MENVVSISLFGNKKIYEEGALLWIARLSAFYPGWRIVFYIETGSYPVIRERACGNVDVVDSGESFGVSGMFWRFQAAWLPGVERVVFRDADSPPSAKEARAVKEWIDSGLDFHIMRDHPSHDRPIMSGMWGAKAQAIKNLRHRIENWPCKRRYQDDQYMLEYLVYPRALNRSLIHTSCVSFSGESFKSFPPGCEDSGGYVGMRNGSRGELPVEQKPRCLPTPMRASRRLFVWFRCCFAPRVFGECTWCEVLDAAKRWRVERG